MQPTKPGKIESKPVSETEFVIPSGKANVSFEKNSSGKIIGLVLLQNGNKTKGKKIK